MVLCIEGFAKKFKFSDNKCRKIDFEHHVMGYQMVLLGCELGSDENLANLKIYKHLYRWIVKNIDGVSYYYDTNLGNIVELDLTMQPHILNDLMQIFKLKRISISDLGIEKYLIIDW